MPEDRQAALLARAHQHLVAVAIDMLRVLSKPKRPAAGTQVSAGLEFSLACIDILHLLLDKEVTVGPNLDFQAAASLCADDRAKIAAANGNPPPAPAVAVFARDLVGWFHGQLTHAAQRTRFHHEGELAALRRAADASTIACALKWFRLVERLDLSSLLPESPETNALVYLMATEDCFCVNWTADGPLFRMLKPPPSSPPRSIPEGLPA